MRPLELLTEKDFFAREFPAPANHYRPLALLAPFPHEDPSGTVSLVRDLAGRGYGGVVLDPANFGPEFLGESWFSLVGRYLEACRLTGLFLWVLDGFTTGPSLAAILDEALPEWRGWEIRTFALRLQGPDRLSLAFTDPEARLLGVLARSLEEPRRAPLDLRPHLSGGMLEWTPPPGRWEIVYLHAVRSQAPPAQGFAWTDAKTVSAWLEIGFAVYRELFAGHFGRTFQGFFVLCPTWPHGHRGGTWPLHAGEPSWEELRGLCDEEAMPPRRGAEAIHRNYLLPLHEWCWGNRLRLAGYRLGGDPLPAAMKSLDLGGLPDLDPGAPPPDLEELAALAGLARSFRQERVVSLVSLSGEAIRDRAAVTGLAAAGADFFLVRPFAGLPSGWERALNDYAARVAMAISAGGPERVTAIRFETGPDAFRAAGRHVFALAARGFEVACVPPGEETKAGEEGEAAATDPPALPPPLALRSRRVEDWQVHLIFNPTAEDWRGFLVLPRPGQVELWSPATGERRPAPVLAEGEGGRLPLVVEAGAAVLVVIRRLGRPGPVPKSAYIRAHLRLPRGWEFVAIGGNVKPLAWEMTAPGRWQTALTLLSTPLEVSLEERPEGADLSVNGTLLPDEAALGRVLRVGVNLLELEGSPDPPRARLRGYFACRGEAIAAPPPVVAGPWTQNGFPYFPGPGLYRQTVEIPPELIEKDLSVWLEVGALADYALVRLNGIQMGSLAWPPYRLHLGAAEIMRPGPNLLELEVYAPAARPAWSFKGLLGEVSLLFGERTREQVG